MCAKIIRLNKMAKEIETIAPETSAASILVPLFACFPQYALAIKLKSGGVGVYYPIAASWNNTSFARVSASQAHWQLSRCMCGQNH